MAMPLRLHLCPKVTRCRIPRSLRAPGLTSVPGAAAGWLNVATRFEKTRVRHRQCPVGVEQPGSCRSDRIRAAAGSEGIDGWWLDHRESTCGDRASVGLKLANMRIAGGSPSAGWCGEVTGQIMTRDDQCAACEAALSSTGFPDSSSATIITSISDIGSVVA